MHIVYVLVGSGSSITLELLKAMEEKYTLHINGCPCILFLNRLNRLSCVKD